MSVDYTYCLGEWEKYFTEKPLSFDEFVDTYQRKDLVYPHIMDKVHLISKNPSKTEFTIQGVLGSGKSTLIYLLAAYKVYLFLILKSAYQFYEQSPTTEYDMAVLGGSRKNYNLFINAFIQTLSEIPFFHKVEDIQDFEKTPGAYILGTPELLRFKHNSNVLHVVNFSNNYDILGRNIIIGIMSDVSFYQEACSVSNADAFTLFQKLKARIDSRFNGKGSTLILEKAPNNVWDDLLDNYIYTSYNPLSIFFHNYWEVFKYKDPTAKCDTYFDVFTGKIVDEPSNNTVCFPSNFNGINLYEKALRNPKEFIRDWIGKPLQIGMNKTSYGVMKQIQDLMYKYHIELIYRHGKMYLDCFEDDVSLCLNEYLPDD